METRTAPDVITTLLSNCALVKPEDMEEALTIASQLGMSVDRALIMSGVATDETLAPALEAAQLVEKKTLSLNDALRALRLALHNGTSLQEAIDALAKVHKRTGVYVAATNELTNILLAAKLITAEQLGKALKRAQETGLLIGQTLLIENMVSTTTLCAAINVLFLMRDAKLEEDKAIQGLRFASQRDMSIEQALFELQFFTQPSAGTLRIGELAEMTGIITRANMIECLEVEFFKQKPFGQILLEQGLISQEQLEAAVLLQNSVSSESMKAFQAARALKLVCKNNTNVYQAMSEVSNPPDDCEELRLGDLLIKSGICDRNQIEAVVGEASDSNIKIGKMLLVSKLVKQSTLWYALRCQSLWKLGYMSGTEAVNALRHAFENEVSLDASFDELGLNVPSRMQWAWV